MITGLSPLERTMGRRNTVTGSKTDNSKPKSFQQGR